MTVNKRKKVVKYRGSHTHGGGAKKKRRGAGNRGGRGMAGSGKRAGQIKPTILTTFGNEYFGKRGFKRPKKIVVKIKSINVSDLEKNLDRYVSRNLIKKESNKYIINLVDLGYNKLLGAGKVTKSLEIKAPFFSQGAKKKIDGAGGSLSN
ncbi:uL15 family ribosomal protein [Candidatus Woesearchaeota archaeon]|nr:uL15 family ribosomal protein [Candidatus Woesearchaeota archaeon]